MMHSGTVQTYSIYSIYLILIYHVYDTILQWVCCQNVTFIIRNTFKTLTQSIGTFTTVMFLTWHFHACMTFGYFSHYWCISVVSPSLFMPACRHFFNRHAWHWFRWALSTGHIPVPAWHLLTHNQDVKGTVHTKIQCCKNVF